MNRHQKKMLRPGLFIAAKLLLLMLAWGLSLGSLAEDRGPVIPKGKGDQCVAETDFMRRNHMDLIIHQRDETVIKGIRDQPFSLVECVDCHVQRDTENKPIRIDAEGQFCASCHAFVAAKIDCFTCHAAVPDSLNDTRADGSHWMPQSYPLSLALQYAVVMQEAKRWDLNESHIAPRTE